MASENMKRPEEVFITDGFPEFTYVPLSGGGKESEFMEGLAQKNKIVSISGPSKSGKTTLCEHVIKNQTNYEYVSITGEAIENSSDLWYEAVNAVRDDTDKMPAEMSYRDRVQFLVDREVALVVDDFHYIKSDLQKTICQQIKNAASAGLRIVCLTVPHRGDDAVRGNGDLSGRFFSVDFEYWRPTDLIQIADKGFPECMTEVPQAFKSRLVAEALRSPQIMQTLCLETCRSINLDAAVTEESFDDAFLSQVKAKTIRSYDRRSDLQILRQGPAKRGKERNLYKFRSGEELDIYQILVEVFREDPPFLYLSLDEIRDRVSAALDRKLPDNVRSALQQYEDLGARPLDWDDEKRRLTVNDPHFYFYLRNVTQTDANDAAV